MTTSMSEAIREPASQMTMSINKTIEKQQQQLAKEVFSPQITNLKDKE